MKINKILVVATLFLAMKSNAQISKGFWMMGGGGSFGNYKNTSGGTTSESFGLGIYPNVGYFLIDKFVVGTAGSLNTNFSSQSETTYGISPFVRYYFLKGDKQINIFSELNYGFQKQNNNPSTFQKIGFKAGTVFFLNDTVGLEIALNYVNSKVTYYENENRSIFLGVGFQIHLEKK